MLGKAVQVPQNSREANEKKNNCLIEHILQERIFATCKKVLNFKSIEFWHFEPNLHFQGKKFCKKKKNSTYQFN